MTGAYIILHWFEKPIEAKIAGLEAGVDEHVPKIMCSIKELVIKMDNVMIKRGKLVAV